MRHFMKKNTSTQVEEFSPNSNNPYSNLVDLALHAIPRSSNIQTSNIHRVLHNTLQEDQSARQGWMISSRNINTSRDRRRFRPQSGGSMMVRQQPEDDAATTRVYRTGSSLISTPNRSINNSHAALIDQAILDLLPLPAGVVSITHGLPFRRPNRDRRSNINSGQEEFFLPGQVRFSQIDQNMETEATIVGQISANDGN